MGKYHNFDQYLPATIPSFWVDFRQNQYLSQKLVHSNYRLDIVPELYLVNF